ncbi:Uma2 family endonuclease [Nonomuraea sp. FMUSA5-5]|uniref:Uma2 family endonuclease n=1 Tax=Nonomuraea composti TaxID=2720023 RepID=A0ABX1B7U3_9ACTN|nr:Uma2 family endonuclease [Nonomuraea sp. FMUSA5-5]NJP93566.1 Uma2 family endonuclease [Nonomuraea sp. FMUSA5-5]
MVAMAIEPPATQPEPTYKPTPRTARDLFEALSPLPGFRTEVIEGTLIVSPSGSPEHFLMGGELHITLNPLCKERGWRGAYGPHVCIDGPRDAVQPDYVVWEAGCKRWGDELLSPGVLMAVEVISPNSLHIDRVDKLRLYALGRVAVYLLVDPITQSPSVTVHSDLEGGRYTSISTTSLGKPLHLPTPIDFELDTSIFMV